MKYISEVSSYIKLFFRKIYFFIKDNKYAFLSLSITFIVLSAIFKKNNFYPFGDKSVAWCDLKQQGIPLLMNLKDILEGNGSLLYSFNNASGMNFWGVFLFFLSNPFSFLCIFFEKAELYKLVSLFLILKLCLSAFTSTFFFIKVNKKTSKLISVALGISYSLCAYGLMYYQNIMWLDIMYLYPLLALGIKRITEQKGYALYTIVLALCVLFNFYLSFMVILSILIIIGLYLLVSKDEYSIKKVAAFNFFKGSAIAAFISATSWIPAFIQYRSSGRGENIIDTISSSSFGTNPNTIFLLVLSSSIIVIGILSLIKPNRNKVQSFLTFFLFSLPILVEPINKMWHTGSYMSFPGRYAFITVFAGLQMVCSALEDSPLPHKKNIKSKYNDCFKILIFFFFAIASVVTINFLYTKISTETFFSNQESLSNFTKTLWGDEEQLKITLKVAGIFALVYFISAILFKLKVFPKRIFSLFLVCVVICEGIFAVNVYVSTISKREIFNGYDSFLDLEDKIEDEDFYRIKTEKKYQDSNLLGALGYNSIGHYTSLTNHDYMNTSKALGYSSSWMELSTYGGTELSDAIMSVKYNVIRGNYKDSVYSNGTYSIQETFAFLGLGIKYDGKNDIFSYEDMSRTDFQEKIFSSLFNSEQTLFEKYNPSIYKDCELTITEKETVINGKGEIIYNINVKGEQTLYFDAFGEFSNNLRQAINKGFEVFVNGSKIAIYPDGMYTGFMKLGTFKDQSVEIRVVTKKSKMSLLSFGVSGLKREVLKNAVENAESGFLSAEDNFAYGKVNGKDGEFLFVSIPYDNGFKVTVNDKKIEPEKVFGDFYSIPLSDGENVIKMVYTPSGFVPGAVITFIGIILFIIFFIIDKNKIKKDENVSQKNNSKIPQEIDFNHSILENKLKTYSFILFIALFIILIFVVYLFPILVKLLKG